MWKEPDCEARLFHFKNVTKGTVPFVSFQCVVILLFSFGNVDFVFTE